MVKQIINTSSTSGAGEGDTLRDAFTKVKSNFDELYDHASSTDNPHGVTAVQIGALPAAEKGAPNGVATLGADGKVPDAQLPDLSQSNALNQKLEVEGQNVLIKGDLIPDGDVVYNLGAPDRRWKDIYVSANTIYIGDSTTLSGTRIAIEPDPNPTNLSQMPTMLASRIVAKPYTYNPGGGNVTVRPSIEFQDTSGISHPISFNTVTKEFSLDANGDYGTGALVARKATLSNPGSVAADLTGSIAHAGSYLNTAPGSTFRFDGDATFGYDTSKVLTIRSTATFQGTASFDGAVILGDGNDTISVNAGSNNNFLINAKNISLTETATTVKGPLVVNGDLTILGTTSIINSTNVEIGDNIVVLNAGLPGSATPTLDAGIQIARGSEASAKWLWNEASDFWSPMGANMGGIGTLTATAAAFTTLTGALTGSLAGNASTATQLAASRTIALAGDATGSTTFNGSANRTITVALASTGVAAGTYSKVVVNAKGLVTGAEAVAYADITSALGYSPANRAGDAFTGAVSVAGNLSTSGDLSAAGTMTAAAVVSTGSLTTASIDSTGFIKSGKGTDGQVTIDAGLIVIGSTVRSTGGTVALSFNPLAGYSQGIISMAPTGGGADLTQPRMQITAPQINLVGTVMGTISAALAADALTTARTIALSGDVTGSATFSGAANATIAASLPSSGVVAGTYAKVVVNQKGLVTASASMTPADITTALAYTPVNKAGDVMSGTLTAPTVIAALSGNATTATTLQTARTISLTGDASGSVSFNGSANAAISVTLTNSGATPGTYGKVVVDSKGRVTAGLAATSADVETSLGYTPANRAGDAFTGAVSVAGSFSATGDISGSAVSAGSVAATGQITGQQTISASLNSDNQVSIGGGELTLGSSARPVTGTTRISFNPVGGLAAPPSITAAPGAGNLGQLTITAPAIVLAGPVTGTISAATVATTLATTRAIGVSGDASGSANFNGSANVSIGLTLASTGVTAGTYTSVTVDAKGRVTAASNPGFLTAESDTLATVTGRGATTATALVLTNATASTSTATGALRVTGGVGIGGGLNVGGATNLSGNVTIGGDLTINGQTLTINSSALSVDDPMITVGGDTAPTTNDGQDRGLAFRWHDGTSAKLGFMGYDVSAGQFQFIPDATFTNEVASGAPGTAVLSITGNAATATALATARTLALSGDATGSASFNGSANATIALTLGASGVTAGTYTSVTVDAKGRVTAGSNPAFLTSESDTLATVTGRGATTATALVLTNATASTTTATGALRVTGGVGVGGALNLGGSLTVSGPATVINSTDITLGDQLVMIGGANAPTSNDGKDRGFTFRWHNGTAAKIGFMGYDVSSGTFQFIPDALLTFDVISGAKGTITADLDGNAASATTLSSTGTYALTGDVSGSATYNGATGGTITTTLANSGVAPGTYDKLVVNAKGIVTGSAAAVATDVTTALGFTPVNAAGDTMTGTLTVPTVVAALTGNATTATRLVTARTILLAGDATGSTTYNGSANSTLTVALAASGILAGTYSKVVVNAKGLVTGSASLVATEISGALGFTPANVAGDSFTGAVSVAGKLSSTNAVVANSASGGGAVELSADENGKIEIGNLARAVAGTPSLVFHSSAGSPAYDVRLQASGGSATSGSGTLSIAAATVSMSGAVTATGTITAPTFAGALAGNATTATTLATTRAIGVSGDASGSANFNGSANVSIGLTLASTGVTAGTYSKVVVNAKGLVTASASLAAADVTTALAFTPANKAGDTITGAFTFSAANAALSFTNAASFIQFPSTGLGAPNYTTRTAGNRIVLSPNWNGTASVDYAIGMEATDMWFSSRGLSNGFKFYGGDAVAASLSGTGVLQTTSWIGASVGNDGEVQVGTSVHGGVEIGKRGRSVAGTPFIDFHASVDDLDYDVRFIASGGGTGAGTGQLNVRAGVAIFECPVRTPTYYENFALALTGAGAIVDSISRTGTRRSTYQMTITDGTNFQSCDITILNTETNAMLSVTNVLTSGPTLATFSFSIQTTVIRLLANITGTCDFKWSRLSVLK